MSNEPRIARQIVDEVLTTVGVRSNDEARQQAAHNVKALLDGYHCKCTTDAEPVLTIEDALTELQEIFPGEIFKIEIEDQRSWLRKSALVLQVSRGLNGFYTGTTLDDCMAQVRAWAKERGDDRRSERGG